MSDMHEGDYDEAYVNAGRADFEKEVFSEELKEEFATFGYDTTGKTSIDISRAVYSFIDSKDFTIEDGKSIRAFYKKWAQYMIYYNFFHIQKGKKMTLTVTNNDNEAIVVIQIPYGDIYNAEYYKSVAESWFFYPYLVRDEVVKGIMENNKKTIDVVNYSLSRSSKGSNIAMMRMIRDTNPEYYKKLITVCEALPVED